LLIIQANRLQDYEVIQAILPKAIQANPPAGEAGRFTGSNPPAPALIPFYAVRILYRREKLIELIC